MCEVKGSFWSRQKPGRITPWKSREEGCLVTETGTGTFRGECEEIEQGHGPENVSCRGMRR